MLGNIKWKTVTEYYELTQDAVPVGPNRFFLGHSNLRMHVMGFGKKFTEKRFRRRIKKWNNHRRSNKKGYLGVSMDMLPFHRWAGYMHQNSPVILYPLN